jgi:uncharacterized membrane protein
MHKAIHVIIVLSLFVIINNAQASTNISLTDDEKTSVLQGNVIVREIPDDSEAGRTFEAIGLFDAPIDDIYNVIADFEKYDQFMPNIVNVRVLQENASSAVMNYTLGLPLGKLKKYRLSMTFLKEENRATLKWHMIEWPGIKKSETINDTRGYWLLENYHGSRSGVLVLYHVYTDPGHIPWGLGWIVDFLTKGTVPNIVKNTRERVYELERLQEAQK